MKKVWITLAAAIFMLCSTSCVPFIDALPGELAEVDTQEWQEGPAPVLNMPNPQEPEDTAGTGDDLTGTGEAVEPDVPALPEKLVWTTEPVQIPMPDDYNGLELPVQGATGYTSIQLPMWRSVEDSAIARSAVEEWQRAKAEEKKRREEEEARRLEEARLAAEARQREEERLRQEARASQANAAVGVTSAGQAPVLVAPPQETGQPGQEEESVSEADEPAADGPETEGLETEGLETEGLPVQEEGEGVDPQAGTETAAPAPEAQPETAGTAEEAPAPVQGPETADPVPEPLPEPEPEVEERGPALTDGAMAILPAGTAFTILQEAGDWWKVRCETDFTDESGEKTHGEAIGWVEHRWCMINLPDVIPSMLYDATNGYASKFVSCGKPLEGITGQALYTGEVQNARLGEPEFMMPVLYEMAFRLCAAQRAALAEGNSLVLYEGYRPLDVQLKVSGVLRAMIRNDAEVRAGVTSAPWNIAWFIATSASNHQHGYAVDVSLARVRSVREGQSGNYRYIRVEEGQLYDMPTAIHELSRAAAAFTTPVASHSQTAWKTAVLAPSMNDPAKGLQKYCTDAGLTPLASEWWHFNDLNARSRVLAQLGTGGFTITRCRSIAP